MFSFKQLVPRDLDAMMKLAPGAGTSINLSPQTARQSLRNAHRTFVLRHALARFARDPEKAVAGPRTLFSDLIYGWGNEGWSGQHEYLVACIDAALTSRGPLLECGSGLTTLLLGLIAQKRGLALWSLEHLPEWAGRVQEWLTHLHVDAVRLHVAPLHRYDSFDWYEPPLDAMPATFSVVVCDGPPSATHGGRYGLLPVMRDNLAADCLILLDDAERSAEQSIVTRWSGEMACKVSLHGDEKPFFKVLLQEQPVA